MSDSCVKRWIRNIQSYNEEHNTDYTWNDVQTKFQNKGQDYKAEPTTCMCERKIEKVFIIENIYTGDKMNAGCDCIEKYMVLKDNICTGCDKIFKRNKYNDKYEDNQCNQCRMIPIQCNKCNEFEMIKFELRKEYKSFFVCDDCKINNRSCFDCRKPSKKYKRCFSCNEKWKKANL